MTRPERPEGRPERTPAKKSSHHATSPVPNEAGAEPDEGWWEQVLEEADAYLGAKR